MYSSRGALVTILFCGGAALALANPAMDKPSADLVEAVSKDRLPINKHDVEQGGLRHPDMHFASISVKRAAPSKIKGGDLFEPKYWSPSFSQPAGDFLGSSQVRVGEHSEGRVRTQPQSQTRLRGQAPSSVQVRQEVLAATTHDKSQAQPSPELLIATYTFVGRMIDDKEVSLFLIKNDRTYVVKVNDVLDNTYRVDKITNVDATLTYLPNNTQQTLTFNSTAVGSSALTGATADTVASAATIPVAPQPSEGPFQPMQQPIREAAPESSLRLPAAPTAAP